MIKNKKSKDKFKEKLKQEELEEKEIEKEVLAEFKKNEENKIKLSDLFNDKDLSDESYNKFLSEKELNELKTMKEEEKKFTIKSLVIVTSCLIFLGVTLFVFAKAFGNETDRILTPAMKNYYKEKYNNSIKIDKIETLMTTLDNKTVETNIKVGYIGNNHIISIDNEPLGDDFNNVDMVNAYKEYFESKFNYIDILSEDTKLSYQDFYVIYNPFIDYINALPNLDFNSLVSSGKLTVNDIVVYQKEIDIMALYEFIGYFSDDSTIYLIKHENGVPINLSIIRKTGISNNDIISVKEVDYGISAYTLDRNTNKVDSIDVKKTNKNNIETIGNKYQVINPYVINVKMGYSYNEDDLKNDYYMLRISSSIIDKNNMILFNPSSYGSNYKEFELNEYPEFAVITIGKSTYLISNSSLGFGTKFIESSILCKIGLCK